MNGEIVWYNASKRYGFVCPSEGGAEIVFHLDEAEEALLGAIARGQAVNYMVRQDPSGPMARRLAPGHLLDDSI
ncbi:MAG: cold-shock protein [Alphaproteobacteria bacterium]|jgi:CspA family cold shock protein